MEYQFNNNKKKSQLNDIIYKNVIHQEEFNKRLLFILEIQKYKQMPDSLKKI